MRTGKAIRHISSYPPTNTTSISQIRLMQADQVGVKNGIEQGLQIIKRLLISFVMKWPVMHVMKFIAEPTTDYKIFCSKSGTINLH